MSDDIVMHSAGLKKMHPEQINCDKRLVSQNILGPWTRCMNTMGQHQIVDYPQPKCFRTGKNTDGIV